MGKMAGDAWKEFGVKVAVWLLGAGLAWLLPWVFLDEPIDYLVPGILLGAGLHLGFFETTPLPVARAGLLKKTIGSALIGASIVASVPRPPEAHLPWQPYSEEAVATARAAGRPVVIDFYAAWCPPCRQLDRKVFSRKKVVAAAREFVALRADLTDSNAPEAIQLSLAYRVEGFPTVVFLGPDGKERSELRLVGYEGPGPFIRRLQAVR